MRLTGVNFDVQLHAAIDEALSAISPPDATLDGQARRRGGLCHDTGHHSHFSRLDTRALFTR
jgi:hypothetical protein